MTPEQIAEAIVNGDSKVLGRELIRVRESTHYALGLTKTLKTDRRIVKVLRSMAGAGELTNGHSVPASDEVDDDPPPPSGRDGIAV
jgi:hypothetical protein